MPFTLSTPERSRNSDLGWESEVRIPTSGGRAKSNSDFGWESEVEFRCRVGEQNQNSNLGWESEVGYAAAASPQSTRRASTLPQVSAICSICAVWHRGPPLSPRSLPYVLYVLFSVDSTYSTYSAPRYRIVHIVHTVHVARTWGRVEAPQAGVRALVPYSTFSAHSAELGKSAGWRHSMEGSMAN